MRTRLLHEAAYILRVAGHYGFVVRFRQRAAQMPEGLRVVVQCEDADPVPAEVPRCSEGRALSAWATYSDASTAGRVKVNRAPGPGHRSLPLSGPRAPPLSSCR